MKGHAIRLEDLPEPFSAECATHRATLGASLPVIGADMYGFVPLWATNTEEDDSEPPSNPEPQKSVVEASSDDAQTSIFTSSNYDLVSKP
jgi:hypothetical protein